MKTYRYRKHILWMKYLVPGALLLYTIFYILPIPDGDRTGLRIGVSIGIAVFQLAIAAAIWWFFGRFARVEVGLSESEIKYRGSKGEIEIPFEEITEINQPSIRYTGGWIKIRSTAKTIRLTVVLEGISDFVRELKDALDQRHLSDRYDRRKLFNFYKTATYADHSWARVYEIFGKLLLILVIGCAIGVLIALSQERERLKDLLLALCPAAFLVYTGVAYGVAEVIIARHFAKATREESFSVPDRDLEFERKVLRRTLLIGGIGAALTVVAFCA